MQRGRKFSFTRMVTNAFPNFANDDPNDVNVSPAAADALVQNQLSQPHPRYLTPSAFFIAGITDNASNSAKVHKALLKSAIIDAPPSNTAAGEMSAKASGALTIHTGLIGKKFASQMAVISVHAQRRLVGVLFFWEEECVRWRLLDEEYEEILKLMGGAGRENTNADLQMALKAVNIKKGLLPSQRGEATANVSAGVGHDLPAYK